VVSRIERGEHPATTRTLQRLAEALDARAVIGLELAHGRTTRYDLQVV
jgi:transcriptional regulator with XRE-family HTH domain